MITPSQSRKKSISQKESSNSLNEFLKPIIEKIVKEKIDIYKKSLKDIANLHFDKEVMSKKELIDFLEKL